MKTNKNLKQNDGALAPVIGAILMIAVALILAALIGIFITEKVTLEATPQTSMKASQFSASGFTINHQGGDPIKKISGTKLLIDGTDVSAEATVNNTKWNLQTDSFSTSQTIVISTIPAGNAITKDTEIMIIDIISQNIIAIFTAKM